MSSPTEPRSCLCLCHTHGIAQALELAVKPLEERIASLEQDKREILEAIAPIMVKDWWISPLTDSLHKLRTIYTKHQEKHDKEGGDEQ